MAHALASPSRRVLANKSTNSYLQLQSADMTTKPKERAIPAQSPRAISASSPPPAQLTRATPRSGQKRRRDEIEEPQETCLEPESQSESQELISDSTISTQPFSDDASDLEVAANFSTMQTTSMSASTPSTLFTSFHASQEPPNPIEDTFEIPEEILSQRTLDRTHAVTFSRGNSQMQITQTLPAPLTSQHSQDSVRMSSFIDLNECAGTKDQDDGLVMIPESSSPRPRREIESPNSKADLAEKAQTLRTRLQLALYKVQTNQAGRPFSRLQKPRGPSPELPDFPPMKTPSLVTRASDSTSSTTTLRGGGGTSLSPESRIAEARARSSNMNQYKPKVRDLGSLKVPDLKPGTFSARYIDDSQDEDEDNAGDLRVTKQRRAMEQPQTPRRDGSIELGGSGSGSGMRTTGRRSRPAVDRFGGLTSSVVKGEAASGLLELRRAAGAV